MVSVVTPRQWGCEDLSRSVQSGIRKEAMGLRDVLQEEAPEMGDVKRGSKESEMMPRF